jgi:hypothetical protein
LKIWCAALKEKKMASQSGYQKGKNTENPGGAHVMTHPDNTRVTDKIEEPPDARSKHKHIRQLRFAPEPPKWSKRVRAKQICDVCRKFKKVEYCASDSCARTICFDCTARQPEGFCIHCAPPPAKKFLA